jgi:hypothetical protein
LALRGSSAIGTSRRAKSAKETKSSTGELAGAARWSKTSFARWILLGKTPSRRCYLTATARPGKRRRPAFVAAAPKYG